MESEQIDLLNYLINIKKIIYEIYLFLSPYIEIAFTACIGYSFFLKQFLREKRSERQSHIQLQKDQLHKEIFDQISSKINSSYLALGDVKKYCILLNVKDPTNAHQFERHFQSFEDKHFELHEVIHSLLLSLEKYDFVIDPEQNEAHAILKLQKELSSVCSEIRSLRYELPKPKSMRNSDEVIYKKINDKLGDLSNTCSKINLQLQKLANKSKELIRNILKSLDEKIK